MNRLGIAFFKNLGINPFLPVRSMIVPEHHHHARTCSLRADATIVPILRLTL